MASKKLKVTLVRSPAGQMANHRKCVRGLGLKKMHQTVELNDTPAIRGLINKVHYLVAVDGE